MEVSRGHVKAESVICVITDYVLRQVVDVDRDWKLLLLFVPVDRICVCESEEVNGQTSRC